MKHHCPLILLLFIELIGVSHTEDEARAEAEEVIIIFLNFSIIKNIL